jgi:hypothetical protein
MRLEAKSLTTGQRATIAQPTGNVSLRSGCYSLIIELKRKKNRPGGKVGSSSLSQRDLRLYGQCDEWVRRAA